MKPLRKCKGCGLEAHSTEDLILFLTAKDCHYGRANFCKKCDNLKNAAWRAANPERYEQHQKDKFNRRIENWNRLFKSFGSKCSRCDFDEDIPDCYDLHHIHPEEKEYGMSHILAGKNWERIEKEAAKCKLYCATCHRKVHYEERQNEVH